MPYINPAVLDSGLLYLQSQADALYLCNQEPSSFANVGAYAVGNKSGLTIGLPAPDGTGRRVTVAAVTGGAVTATDVATHWALVSAAGSQLLAAGPLSAAQAMTSGNDFSLAAFDVGLGGF